MEDPLFTFKAKLRKSKVYVITVPKEYIDLGFYKEGVIYEVSLVQSK